MLRKVLLVVSLPLLFLAAGCSLVAGNGDAPTAVPDPGAIIITVDTEPAGQAGSFTFTGVPSGTLTSDSTLVVADLAPGTYTTTQVDPAPQFDR